MFEYQKYGRYFVQAAGKMEEICEKELQSLGIKKTKQAYRGVYFNGTQEELYRVNYQSRLAVRVLAPLITFACHSTKYLTKTATENIDWEQFLTLDKTFAINASVSNSNVKHSLYASQCLKDGIADYFNNKYGKRPNVDVDNPDVQLNLHIQSNKAVISLDTSGAALHKRGYRKTGVMAPMQETLAAALIFHSGWDGESELWDPFCGSGTILCEALMHYCRIPAQYLRKKFGFFELPDFDEELWEKVREESKKNMRPLPEGLLRGTDKDSKAVAAAAENISQLPYYDNVILARRAFQDARDFENGVVVTNPPYGIRLGDKEGTAALYKMLGDFLKKKCCGTSSYIYIGDTSLRKSIGLKPTWKKPLVNGSLQGELLKIDSFKVNFRQGKKQS